MAINPIMTRLAQYLSTDRIVILNAADKKEALNVLVNVIGQSPDVDDVEELRTAVFNREKTLSTGIGLGIAVPHARIPTVHKFVVALGISHEGVEFNSLDDKPVHIIMMIVGPEGQQEQYLQILARATKLLKDPDTRSAIISAGTPQEIHRLFTTKKPAP